MIIGVIAAALTESIYGVSFVFTKSAVDVLTPAALLAWRFAVALAAFGLLVALRIVKLTLTRAQWPALGALAICQPLAYYAAETIGVQRTTASESGLLLAMIPVAVVVASWLMLRRRPSTNQLVGIAITFVGVVTTVVAGGVRAGFDPLGYLALLGAVASYALSVVLADRDTATTGLDKTFAMILVGAVVFSAVALVEAAVAGRVGELLTTPLRQPAVLGAIGYLALVSSIGAFFLQAVAIRRLGSTRFSTFIGVSTLMALIAAALVLGERLSGWQIAGGALILVGVYVANAGNSDVQSTQLASDLQG